MNVIVDSNILIRDRLVRSGRWQVLQDYLKKTSSRLLIPRLVYEEVRADYERRLAGVLAEFRKCCAALEDLDIDAAQFKPSIDVTVQAERFAVALLRKLAISEHDYRINSARVDGGAEAQANSSRSNNSVSRCLRLNR
jgi:predicted nucleic acid-binding protein